MNKFENGSGISLVLEECDPMISYIETIQLFEIEKYNSELVNLSWKPESLFFRFRVSLSLLHMACSLCLQATLPGEEPKF